MLLFRKGRLVKSFFFFLKKNNSKECRLFLGNNYLTSYSRNSKNSVSGNYTNPLVKVCKGYSHFFFFKNTGLFNLFFNQSSCLIFLPNAKSNSVFSYLFDFFKNKTLYRSSNGTYITYKFINLKKKTASFVLPSGKNIVSSLFLFGFFGRGLGKLTKIKFNLLYKNGSKKKRVSGVSMNPVDHHNGGRSNRKPLFLNKYGNVAKFGKRMLKFYKARTLSKVSIPFKNVFFFFKFFNLKRRFKVFKSLTSIKPLFKLIYKIKKSNSNLNKFKLVVTRPVFFSIKKVFFSNSYLFLFFKKKKKFSVFFKRNHNFNVVISRLLLNKKIITNFYSFKTYNWLIFKACLIGLPLY